VNASSTTMNLEMPVTTSSSAGGANTVTVQLRLPQAQRRVLRQLRRLKPFTQATGSSGL
jgi:hypothetical protein